MQRLAFPTRMRTWRKASEKGRAAISLLVGKAPSVSTNQTQTHDAILRQVVSCCVSGRVWDDNFQ